MTVLELYEGLGSDYADAVRRLGSEERLRKFLIKFSEDGSFAALEGALARSDCAAAFRACHTLKGIALNLGLAPLSRTAAALAECLRGQDAVPECAPLYEALKRDFQQTADAIDRLKTREVRCGE